MCHFEQETIFQVAAQGNKTNKQVSKRSVVCLLLRADGVLSAGWQLVKAYWTWKGCD
jgi:hypothetical protein